MAFIRAQLIWILVGIGALLVAVFSSGLYSNMLGESSVVQPTEQVSQNPEKPVIVSTVPKSLDQSTILPNQTIEIGFSHPLENVPETRWEIQPAADIRAELSDDRKTLKLIPNNPYNLGQSYTLFIRPETKIEGRKTLEKEYIYHFRTIEFKGS